MTPISRRQMLSTGRRDELGGGGRGWIAVRAAVSSAGEPICTCNSGVGSPAHSDPDDCMPVDVQTCTLRMITTSDCWGPPLPDTERMKVKVKVKVRVTSDNATLDGARPFGINYDHGSVQSVKANLALPKPGTVMRPCSAVMSPHGQVIMVHKLQTQPGASFSLKFTESKFQFQASQSV